MISCLGCRCPVHALGLAVLAMLGSEPVNALICNAHMMASRFHASSAASALLADEAKEMGINAELLPCNLSQVQSVHDCLQSLVQMEHAIKQMLQHHPDFPMNQAVCSLHAPTHVPFWSGVDVSCFIYDLVLHAQLSIMSQIRHTTSCCLSDFSPMFQVSECVNRVSFWSQIAEFCKLLAPITDVLRGNLSQTSSLADVVLHWLQLARLLQAADGANLPPGELEGSAFQCP